MKAYAALSLLFALSARASPVAVADVDEVNAFDLQARAAAPAINQGALSLIEGLEGFRPNFYSINGDQTIGYGHDCTQLKDCSSIHAPITQAQGQQLLQKDLPSYESCVCKLPNAGKLNANQYGALVSFTYNSGCGGVAKYFDSIMQSGNPAEVCQKLPTTNTLNGELSSRRQKEGAFCGQATSDMSGCDGSSSPAPTSTTAPKPTPKPKPAKAPRDLPAGQPRWS